MGGLLSAATAPTGAELVTDLKGPLTATICEEGRGSGTNTYVCSVDPDNTSHSTVNQYTTPSKLPGNFQGLVQSCLSVHP